MFVSVFELLILLYMTCWDCNAEIKLIKICTSWIITVAVKERLTLTFHKSLSQRFSTLYDACLKVCNGNATEIDCWNYNTQYKYKFKTVFRQTNNFIFVKFLLISFWDAHTYLQSLKSFRLVFKWLLKMLLWLLVIVAGCYLLLMVVGLLVALISVVALTFLRHTQFNMQ